MKLLAIESSAKAASVAVTQDGFLLAERYQNNGLTHSRTLMPLCEEMLTQCGLSLGDIDTIACANGPGSFTGLRIGLSTAKGLAWVNETPCVGVSTLEAMAWNASPWDGLICCAMDARRNQVYHALFEAKDGVVKRLCDDCAIALSDLFSSQREKTPMLVVGDGAELCWRYGQEHGFPLRLAPEHIRYQHAWGVARAALEEIARNGTCSGSDLNANYLRLSQAERERLERLNSQP